MDHGPAPAAPDCGIDHGLERKRHLNKLNHKSDDILFTISEDLIVVPQDNHNIVLFKSNKEILTSQIFLVFPVFVKD